MTGRRDRPPASARNSSPTARVLYDVADALSVTEELTCARESEGADEPVAVQLL